MVSSLLWDWKTKKPLQSLSSERVLFGRSDYLLVSSFGDHFELIRSDHQKLPPIKLLKREMVNTSIQVSPDLTRAIVDNNDQNLSLYDLATGQLVSRFYGDSRSYFIRSARYLLDGRFIAVTMGANNGGKFGGEIWLLDGHTGAVILAVDDSEAEPDQASPYSILASGGSQFLTVTDKVAQLWKFPARCEELIRLARARDGARELTPLERQENFVLPEGGEYLPKVYATAKRWLDWALPSKPRSCF